MTLVAQELPTFSIKGSSCKTYSISIILDLAGQNLPCAHRLRNPALISNSINIAIVS